MFEFLKLPREIRDKIYLHVARGANIKHVPGMRTSSGKVLQRASVIALLLSCKQIQSEIRPILPKCVRFDITSLVDRKQGTVGGGIDPAILQYVKVEQGVFSERGGMKLLKSMSHLTSLQYYGVAAQYYIPGSFDSRDHCICKHGCKHCYSEEEVLECLKDDVTERVGLMLGHVHGGPCDEWYDECGCVEDNAFRKVVGVWEYLEQPFRLTALVDIICRDDLGLGEYVEARGRFDLGAKTMKVFRTYGSKARLMGKCKVKLDKY